MKKILILFALLVTSTTICFSQDMEYKTAVNKLIAVSGSQKAFQAAISQIIGTFKKQRPEVQGQFWENISAEMMKTSVSEMADMLAPIYQKHLTLDDMKKLIEFYESPIGKKFAEKTPMITQESMAVGQEWGMKVGRRIMERLQAGKNSPNK